MVKVQGFSGNGHDLNRGITGCQAGTIPRFLSAHGEDWWQVMRTFWKVREGHS